MNDSFRVRTLLAEDNPTDALLLRQALAEVHGVQFDLTCVENLADCLAQIEERTFDGVLVDLGLPDSSGLDTFLALYNKIPHTPILVLTALSDEEVGLRAVKLGAQDYLIKGQVEISLLGRVIRYAIERHQLQKELEDRQQRERHDREVRSMERLSQAPGTPVTGGIYASPALRQSHPQEFQDLLGRYAGVLERALDQRVYKSVPEEDESLRDMGQELGFLRAGPRDVIEIHTNVVQRLVSSVPLARAQAYLEEGRLAALELMGYLAGYYRNYYSGLHRKEASQ